MSNRTIVLFVALFALIVVGMFLFTYFYQKNTEPVALPSDPAATTTQNSYGVTRIDGKHFFINGVHTIVGELALPTPCGLLTTESRVAESFPEQVTFTFEVVNTTEVCAQVITNQRFKIDASASDQANLTATFMGKPVELNLVEAEPGETPEQFELYIKG
ncbi:hypothetical protein K2P47_03165 [Patescibacteria group bacterium]|nr:hypothetical protein [Patescibacteria group bacterium]